MRLGEGQRGVVWEEGQGGVEWERKRKRIKERTGVESFCLVCRSGLPCPSLSA